MNKYSRRNFLKSSVIGVAAVVTTRAKAAISTESQKVAPNRGIHHPFFAQAKNPDVIAHRGGDGQWPGETMYAMRKAQAIGADVLEMDVYRVEDRDNQGKVINDELILMHDPDVKTTTTRKGKVHTYSLKQITDLRADAHWSPECESPVRPEDLSLNEAELHVPTLKQVLEAFPDTRMVIEMKRAPKEFSPVERLCELLTATNKTEQVLVASFHAPFMEQFRRSLPSVATSLTLSAQDALKMSPFAVEQFVDKVLPKADEQGPDALELPHLVITKRVVQRVKERGLVLHAWTVNTPKAMDRMIELGVDGIITDCPGFLLRRLGRLP